MQLDGVVAVEDCIPPVVLAVVPSSRSAVAGSSTKPSTPSVWSGIGACRASVSAEPGVGC